MLMRAMCRNLIFTAVLVCGCFSALFATKSSAAPTLFKVPNTDGATAIAPANYSDSRGPGFLIAREHRISLISASGGTKKLIGSGKRCRTFNELCGESDKRGGGDNGQPTKLQPIPAAQLDLHPIEGMAMGQNDDVFFLEAIPMSPERTALRYFSNASKAVETISNARGIFRVKVTNGSFKEITIQSKKLVSTPNGSVYFSGTTRDFARGNGLRDAVWHLNKDNQGWFIEEIAGHEASLKLELAHIIDISVTPTGGLLVAQTHPCRIIEITQLDGNERQPRFAIERLARNQHLFRGISAVALGSENSLVVGAMYPFQIITVSADGSRAYPVTKFCRDDLLLSSATAPIAGKPAPHAVIEAHEIIATPEYNGYFVLTKRAHLDDVYFIGPNTDPLIVQCNEVVATLNAAGLPHEEKIQQLKAAFRTQVIEPLKTATAARVFSAALVKRGAKPQTQEETRRLHPRQAFEHCPMIELPKDVRNYIDGFVQHRTPEEHMKRWRTEMLVPSLHNLVS